ncbi:hypothetical protein L596_000194 [Steinernema carpocapsae]|uniref:Tubulin--tyrosine ligase-like protein 12 SET-like domain-containing protein n=1 Tax=Steinernema carpocapsae TaxID=34508 RepID=A0A4U8UI76_STECR|nr:hypothetical protein L596_000194 [Steinernema carpocapsae]
MRTEFDCLFCSILLKFPVFRVESLVCYKRYTRMSDDVEEQMRQCHIEEVTAAESDEMSQKRKFSMEDSHPDFSLEEFLEVHQQQLQAAAIPSHFWPAIYYKLEKKVYDAGSSFEMVCEDGAAAFKCHARATCDIDPSDMSCVYLLDHALTFKPKTLRYCLRQLPGELKRWKEHFGINGATVTEREEDEDSVDEFICDEKTEQVLNAVDTSGEEPIECKTVKDLEAEEANLAQSPSEGSSIYEMSKKDDDDVITKLMEVIWKKAQTYSVRMRTKEYGEEDTPVWYLMDEFGMSIGHSLEPNFRAVPFYYTFDGNAYSLLFPVKAVKSGEFIDRNYIEGKTFVAHPEWKDALLHPWEPLDLSEVFIPRVVYRDDYYKIGRQNDQLPEKVVERHSFKSTDTLKIFADDIQLIEKLKKIKYELVDLIEEADVIWLRNHFYNYKDLANVNPRALVNQFPCENLLTVKDLFAACILSSPHGKSFDDKTLEYEPAWLPTTFNLEMELPAFVSHFQKREKKGLDNTWIIKPWNLARGLDMNVSDNLDFIIRSIESGPKIACKYIERPLLITRPDNGNNVKFDLRYIVFLRSVDPLDVCLYKNFWIRFGIKEFSLLHLDCNDTHFTVHNYGKANKVYQMTCHTFMTLVENHYPQLKWIEVQKKINGVIKGVFQLLAENPRPTNIVHDNQSRAMYGLDMMLKWNDAEETDLGVSFIEANFMPDCIRACEYYPDFADTVFQTLFTDEPLSDQVEKL